MNVFSFLSTLAIIPYTYLAVFALTRKPGKPGAAAFAGFSLLYAFWSFMYAFMSSAPTKAEAWMWIRVFAFSYIISGPCFLHFALRFTGSLKRKQWPWIFLMYLPGIVLTVRGSFRQFMFVDLKRIAGAWHEIGIQPSLWAAGYHVYYYLCIVTGLIIIGVWGKRSAYLREKKQARTIVAGFLATLFFITLNNYLPALQRLQWIPVIPHLWTIIWAGSIWYAVHRYDFLGDVSFQVVKNPLWRLFTKREQEIVALLKKGFSYRQISETLFISYHTVKTHVEHIYDKAKVKNRSQLLYALDNAGELPAEKAVPVRRA